MPEEIFLSIFLFDFSQFAWLKYAVTLSWTASVTSPVWNFGQIFKAFGNFPWVYLAIGKILNLLRHIFRQWANFHSSTLRLGQILQNNSQPSCRWSHCLGLACVRCGPILTIFYKIISILKHLAIVDDECERFAGAD